MRSKLAALLSLVIVGVMVPPAVESTPARAAGCVTIPAVAHRGGTERYVENSANAFRDATNRGAGVWENDMRVTADGVWILMHDETVDRTTDGTGAVAELTWAQISTMRTADGQPVMTLAQQVNDLEVDGGRLLAELKVDPTAEQWKTLVATLTSRPGLTSRIILTSFDAATLTEAKTQAPAYARGLISELGDIAPAAVTPYAHILIKHHNAITASRMAAWTGGGLTVYSWTVDSTSEWDRMTWYPALAGVITNLVGGYLAWQKGRTC